MSAETVTLINVLGFFVDLAYTSHFPPAALNCSFPFPFFIGVFTKISQTQLKLINKRKSKCPVAASLIALEQQLHTWSVSAVTRTLPYALHPSHHLPKAPPSKTQAPSLQK